MLSIMPTISSSLSPYTSVFLSCLERSDPQAAAVLKRSDPRRDCLKAEGRSSNLKARRADPRAAEGVAVSTGGAYAPEQLKEEGN